MPETGTRYLKYPGRRDLVFILGAGASRGDGLPLQENILPLILANGIDPIPDSEIGRDVVDFIGQNFHCDTKSGIYPKIEAVFGFIDYFLQQNESLSARYNLARIREIKEHLIKLVHYIVNLKTDKGSTYYHRFWEAVIKRNPNSSIVTLNYDTLLEQAFESFFGQYGYIDYGIHLMNYERIEVLKDYNFWINPAEPVKVNPGDDPKPFKIIKLHGSLNWKYCNCCNQVLLTPWHREIDLKRGKFLGYTYPDRQVYEYDCPLDGAEFQTLIMPPSYVKPLNHPVISQLTNQAAREIRSARKLVFIGYSLSDADIHIKALLKKQLKQDTEIVVVNPGEKKIMLANYRSLSDHIHFYHHTFEDMLGDEAFMAMVFNG